MLSWNAVKSTTHGWFGRKQYGDEQFERNWDVPVANPYLAFIVPVPSHSQSPDFSPRKRDRDEIDCPSVVVEYKKYLTLEHLRMTSTWLMSRLGMCWWQHHGVIVEKKSSQTRLVLLVKLEEGNLQSEMNMKSSKLGHVRENEKLYMNSRLVLTQHCNSVWWYSARNKLVVRTGERS